MGTHEETPEMATWQPLDGDLLHGVQRQLAGEIAKTATELAHMLDMVSSMKAEQREQGEICVTEKIQKLKYLVRLID